MESDSRIDDRSRLVRAADAVARRSFSVRQALRSRWSLIRGRSGQFAHPEESERASQLTRNWETKWPGAMPLGYAIPVALRDRWVRIHSLPESKRYPETQDEYREVIRRHRAVIDDLAAGQPTEGLVIVLAEYDWRDLSSGRMRRHAMDAWPWRSAATEEGEGSYYFWVTSGVSGVQLDALLTRVADDEGSFLVANPELDWLFFPYDGGADVYLPLVESVDAFRERYVRWLSPRSDGL